MCDWKETLNCNECGHELDFPQAGDSIICSNCKKVFKLTTNEISYALAESYSRDYYNFQDNATILIRCFNNPPKDILEEAYLDTRELKTTENDPNKLLNVIKKYHDALKMRVRRLLELYQGELSTGELEHIKVDHKKNGKPLNIKNLFQYLKKAYPRYLKEIDNIYDSNIDMIEKMWWIRNKYEHISHTQWPINAKIFREPDKNPDSKETATDILNYDFVKRVNNVSINLYLFIMQLGPETIQQWEIDSIEIFRVK
jgi:hypothetical protein